MRHLTIIGESPNFSNEGEHPFAGLGGTYLRELLKVDDLNQIARTTYLFGFSPAGSFPIRIAQLAAKKFKLSPVNLFCGRIVGMAFDLTDVEFFDWYIMPNGEEAAVIPSPAKTNYWWKDERNYRRAKKFFRNLLLEEGEELERKL